MIAFLFHIPSLGDQENDKFIVMLHTFKAILKGNELEWIDESPVRVNHQPVLVHVTFLEEVPDTPPEPPRPHAMNLLNQTTLHALKEVEAGQGKLFDSVEELFRDLES